MDRIADRPDMTSAVDRGRKASTQTNKQKFSGHVCFRMFEIKYACYVVAIFEL